jgi:cytochrome c7-like protein
MRLWLFFLGACLPVLAQISPGPLSKAHDHLSGPANCRTCHIFGAGAPRLKCLSCHQEIKQRIATGRGYHAVVVKNSAGAEDCARCHTEHYGIEFNIVKWESTPAEFDHRKAGYALVGKHAGLACNGCHNAKIVSKVERSSIRVKDLNHTYLGLSLQCTTCHADEHRGQLGADCARCHTLQGWKPTTGFDHQSTKYPLTGLHEKVACNQCHRPRNSDATAKLVVGYKDIPFNSCTDCHKDPHRGAFTAPCQNCHTTAGWKHVAEMSASFDHGKTKFPLHGAHVNTACEKCHRDSDFKKPVAFAKCADCHAPDPHRGQFQGNDCKSCHSEEKFKPSIFTVERHQKSAYPLAGKHAAVECAKCHLPAGKETRYKVAFGACLDCHKDAHAGQFAAAPYGNKCEPCHTVEGFRPSTYTLSRHQETHFPLAGGHAATACAECHKPDLGQPAAAPARYHFDSEACTSCHQDPHQGDTGSGSRQGCEVCHNVRSWKETAAFDHSTTKYDLQGAHRAVGCLECHRAVIGAGPRKIVFPGAPTDCIGCHADIHGGQFPASITATRCLDCHSMAAWRPSVFNHERQSSFSLKGAHEAVPCQDCHKEKSMLGGRMVVMYKSAPQRCSACHADQ